jgi:hypothetical protein
MAEWSTVGATAGTLELDMGRRLQGATFFEERGRSEKMGPLMPQLHATTNQ